MKLNYFFPTRSVIITALSLFVLWL